MADRLLKSLQAALWVFAAVMLIHWGLAVYDRTHYQAQAQLALDNASEPGSAEVPSVLPHDWLGRLEIPRLDFSAIVLEGADDAALELGVGHIGGTALPGATGNAALAGHRDTFFRALRKVQPGDEIRWTSLQESAKYIVESTEVVDPSQTEVLDPTPDSRLTLVTCYPFGYIGPAPKRFIVKARLVDAQARLSNDVGVTVVDLRKNP